MLFFFACFFASSSRGRGNERAWRDCRHAWCRDCATRARTVCCPADPAARRGGAGHREKGEIGLPRTGASNTAAAGAVPAPELCEGRRHSAQSALAAFTALPSVCVAAVDASCVCAKVGGASTGETGIRTRTAATTARITARTAATGAARARTTARNTATTTTARAAARTTARTSATTTRTTARTTAAGN